MGRGSNRADQDRDCLRGCQLSKLSTLKQEAYQAGKKRDWSRAVTVYEQILELDKNNPTVINELGDLCLKLGESSQGVKHFLGAAAKYRQSGLLNNAVAIYKKILRYEENNQNAHWYLAESRASQGLIVEGEKHGLIFLSHRESLTGEIKEIFLKRCVKLFGLYPGSFEIQDNLLQVFRMWNLSQEAGRAQIQLGCLQWVKGEEETATQMVNEALKNVPELTNYPEHAHWMELQGTMGQSESVQGFDSVSLEDPFATPDVVSEVSAEVSDEIIGQDFPDISLEPTVEPIANPAADDAVELAATATPDASSFGEVDFSSCNPEPGTFDLTPKADEETPVAPVEEAVIEKPVAPVEAEPEVDAPDDNGCFNLDLGGSSSFDDLIAQATENVPEEPAAIEEFPALDQQGACEPIAEVVEEPKVNLLDELLAEDLEESWSTSDNELATISKEIGAQVGGSEQSDDPASLYEMGMVYLEMGLYDQAAESFQKASCHQEYAVRAYEMWGITLQRANRIDEAIAVLTDGLDVPQEGSREYLGLLYHIARAHEQGKNSDEALRLFEMIQKQDPGFLDVGRRLSALANLS